MDPEPHIVCATVSIIECVIYNIRLPQLLLPLLKQINIGRENLEQFPNCILASIGRDPCTELGGKFLNGCIVGIYLEAWEVVKLAKWS